jgi:hypothetical protein
MENKIKFKMEECGGMDIEAKLKNSGVCEYDMKFGCLSVSNHFIIKIYHLEM